MARHTYLCGVLGCGWGWSANGRCVDGDAREDGVVEAEVGGVAVEVGVYEIELEFRVRQWRSVVRCCEGGVVVIFGEVGPRLWGWELHGGNTLGGFAEIAPVGQADFEVAVDLGWVAEKADGATPGVVVWEGGGRSVGWVDNARSAECDAAEVGCGSHNCYNLR